VVELIKNFYIPPSIAKSYNKLVELCETYPEKIPLAKAAEFLSIDKEGLRSSIEQERCQFGICVKKSIHGNRAFTIPTITFYCWALCGGVFKTLKIKKLDNSKPRKYKIKRAT